MTLARRRILVTGANGFIGKNLVVRLGEIPNVIVSTFVRDDDSARLPQLVAHADAVIHLAAENRPIEEAAFTQVNAGLTSELCNAIQQEYSTTGRHVPLVFASSTQVEQDTPYGRSKLAAEQAVQALAQVTATPCIVFRLPGVFGKWCKPNYNSVVATFCHNLARDLPIQINDPMATVRLVYVDDVVTALLSALETAIPGCVYSNVKPEYTITLGKLAAQIRAFADCRTSLVSERVGTGLTRALYATYVSYLPNEKFSYQVPQHTDPRGVFVEMLKTPDSGQFSYFTAHPGITRGGHYHHTKSEKFLVIKGKALFRFRHLLSDELVELFTSGAVPQVVDSIPGWSHDITNVGDDEMIVMLWANENFDREKPDTVASKV
ncbi:UDP-2-acetamido-2,6-beta-L-arabino-hexul-4-ose reductase [Chromobacterium amazonense]|uniref:NAD-dependent epimerase/dehydratase family protein n=1 Tax=Chromobacterium amazonense TaxID=1382803 RepID=A0ABU8V1D6_9NEIS|nr:NAD-dependent epimerase/dehydratase family protein [Chromobacterium amazonense]MDQ4542236.1 NAD-dependent epimerase/dehydratase family protein [Chromobacterium amazonense]